MQRPEQAIQKAVIQHLKTRGVPGLFFWHPFSGGYRRPIEAAIYKSLGSVSGLPDIFVIHAGRMYALELKTLKGKLTMVQVNCHSALRAAGVIVATAHGLDNAMACLEFWGLLRGKAAA